MVFCNGVLFDPEGDRLLCGFEDVHGFVVGHVHHRLAVHLGREEGGKKEGGREGGGREEGRREGGTEERGREERRGRMERGHLYMYEDHTQHLSHCLENISN